MPSAAYFRRQADICLRLSLIASDEEVSNRLIIMAREYATKADAIAIKEADATSAAERTAFRNSAPSPKWSPAASSITRGPASSRYTPARPRSTT